MEKGIIILAKYKNNNSNSSNRSSSNNNSINNNNNNNTIILIFQQNELSAISFQFSSFKIDLILIFRDKTFPPKLFKAFSASADLRSSSALDRENEQQQENAIWCRLFY